MYSDGETPLCGRFLSEVEQVRITLVADSHDTMSKGIISVLWPNEKSVSKLTRHGKVFRQLCQGQRWYQQSGEQWFLRAWRSTRAQTFVKAGSCQRSAPA